MRIAVNDRLLFVFLIALPFCWLNPGMPRHGQLITLTIMATLMVSALISNIWLKMFGFYVAAWHLFTQILFQIEPSLPLLKAKTILEQSTMFIFYGLVLFVVISKSSAPLKWFYNAICVSVLAQAVAAIPNYFGANSMTLFINWLVGYTKVVDPFIAVSGTLENPNFFGSYLAISMPFFLRGKWKYFIPVLAIMLFSTKSSVAVVSAVAGVVVCLGSWRLAGVMALFVAAYVIYDKAYEQLSTSSNGRMNLWLTLLKNIKLNWFNITFGHGTGQHWGYQFPVHNEYLQILYEHGAVGVALLVGYILTIYRRNRILFASFVAICVNMAGNYPLHLAPSALLIIVILSMMERCRQEYNQRRIEGNEKWNEFTCNHY